MNPRLQAIDERADAEADLIDKERYAKIDDPEARARDLRIAEDVLGLDELGDDEK